MGQAQVDVYARRSRRCSGSSKGVELGYSGHEIVLGRTLGIEDGGKRVLRLHTTPGHHVGWWKHGSDKTGIWAGHRGATRVGDDM